MNDRSFRRQLLLHYARFLMAGLLWALSLWTYALAMALMALEPGKGRLPWQAAVIWLPAVAGTFAASNPGRRSRTARLVAALLLTAVVLTVAGLVASLAAAVLTSAWASGRPPDFYAALWLTVVQVSAALLVRYACYPPGSSWLMEALGVLALILIPALTALPGLMIPAGVAVWVVMAWGAATVPAAGPEGPTNT